VTTVGEAESTRDRILQAVRAYPGIHLRSLVRHLGTSLALIQYHLRALEEAGQVRSHSVEGFHRYFPVETYRDLTPRERAILNLLRRERPLEIVLALLEFGRLQHKELVDIVGGSKAALTYHLEKLADAGIVQKVAKGDERGFTLRDPDAVRRLLARFQPVGDLPARVHDTWDDLFAGHRARSDESL
jgi:predicted transcriptional regulator